MTARTGDLKARDYEYLQLAREAQRELDAMYRHIGARKQAPSIWQLPTTTGFAYTAPRGSFWHLYAAPQPRVAS